MTTGKALNGNPYAGNPHVRFDEGEVASAATPRRGSLLYKAIARAKIGRRALTASAALAAALAAFTASAATLSHRWSFNGTTDAANLTDSVGNVTATKNTDRITWDGTNMVMRGNGESKIYTGLELGNNLLDTSSATIEIWATPRVYRTYIGIFEYAASQSDNIHWRFFQNGNYLHQCAALPGRTAADQFRNTLDEPAHFSVTFSTSGNATTVRFMRRNAKTGAIEYVTTCATTKSIADFANPRLFIGGTMWSDKTPDADYDEVRIWSGVLSDDQLTANVLAGPDAPIGGATSGVEIPANVTFTVPTTGGYGYWTAGTVTLGAGAKIRFDTTGYFGTGLRFKTGGITVPSGSVLDYVELSDAENYEKSMEDANTILVQLKGTIPLTSTWQGGTPATAADLSNAANWASVNAAGTAISSAPTSKTTVVIPADRLASFTIPTGATVNWGHVLLGGHAATRYGYKDGAPDSMRNAWRDLALSGYTAAGDVPNGANDISYFTATKDTPGTPAELGTAQIRLDGWFYVTAAQAGLWSMPNYFDDVLSFAIDGEWVLLNSTYLYTNGAGAYVSEGWHRFTLAAAETGGGWGSRYKFADGVFVPFAISINGGARIQFSADNFTFGTDATTVKLTGNADWSAIGAIALESGLSIDLDGHNLSVSDIDAYTLGASITNSAVKKSVLVLAGDPSASAAVTKGLVKGLGSSILTAQAGALSATWTGAANNGSALDANNWEDTLTEESVVPTANHAVTIIGTAVNLQIPAGSTFTCKSFEIGNCTLTTDCDWRGLSHTPTIIGAADLNGHTLTLNHLVAMGGASFSNSSQTDGEVRFYADGGTVTATETTFIDGIANLTTAANAKIVIVHTSGDVNGTLNVGAVNNHTMFRAEGGKISMTANGQVGMVNGSTGYLDITGGTVDFCTANNRGLQLGTANARSYVTISDGKLLANWIDAGHDDVTECTIVQTGGEVETGVNNNGNLWLGRNARGKATYTLSGGSIYLRTGTLDVGNYGTGTFTQDGGTVTIAASDLRVGQESTATGTYTFNSGTVTPKFWFLIGGKGAGTFTQNGGSAVLTGADNNNGNWVAIGRYAGGNGTYVMNDGSLEVGTGTRGGGICVGFDANGVGRFEMNGGTVTAPTIFRYNGHGTVLLNGGTIKAAKDGGTSSSTFASDIGILKNIDNLVFGRNATTIDTDGHNTSMSGNTVCAERGSTLVKQGAGTLTVDAIPPVGSVVVSNGTVAVSSGTAYPAVNAESDNTYTASPSSELLANGYLLHRWNFNGHTLDLVGNNDAVVSGNNVGGAVQSATSITLPGGARGTCWMDCGSNIIPAELGDTPFTIEFWATPTSIDDWRQWFALGHSSNPNGTGGLESGLCMAAKRGGFNGANVGVVYAPSRNVNNTVGDAKLTAGKEYHVAVAVTPKGNSTATISVYIEDTTAADAAGHEAIRTSTIDVEGWSTATIVQNNFWLGHSHWGDWDVASSYNEMRVWAAALSQAQVEANGRLGADTLPVFTDRCSLGMAKNVEIASGAMLSIASGQTLTQPVVKGSGTLAGGNLVVTERMNVTPGQSMTVESGATLDLTGADIVVTGEIPAGGCVIATAPSGGIVTAAPRQLTGALADYKLYLESNEARIVKVFELVQRAGGENVDVEASDALLTSIGLSPTATASEVNAFLNASDPNGLRRWENLVTGTATNQPPLGTVSAETANGNELTLSVKMVADTNGIEKVGLGYDVLRELRKGDGTRVAGPSPDGTAFDIELLNSAGTSSGASGLYRVVTLLAYGSVTNEIPSTNAVGIVEVASTATNTITAVPWKRLASAPGAASDLTVSNFVAYANLSDGDAVYMLDGRAYKMWKKINGKWEAATTVSGSDTSISIVQNPGDPDVATIPCGGAVWVQRTDATKPYFLVGQYDESAFSVTVPGSGAALIANPFPTNVTLNAINWGTSVTNDIIRIPRNGLHVDLSYKDGKWGYYNNVPVINNGIFTGAKEFVPYTDPIPAGTGFIYDRKGGEGFPFEWK